MKPGRVGHLRTAWAALADVARTTPATRTAQTTRNPSPGPGNTAAPPRRGAAVHCLEPADFAAATTEAYRTAKKALTREKVKT